MLDCEVEPFRDVNEAVETRGPKYGQMMDASTSVKDLAREPSLTLTFLDQHILRI